MAMAYNKGITSYRLLHDTRFLVGIRSLAEVKDRDVNLLPSFSTEHLGV